MSFYDSPVAKRTRLQRRLFNEGISGRNEGGCCSCSKIDQSRNQSRQLGSGEEIAEVVDVDEHWANKSASKSGNLCTSPSQSKTRISEDNMVDASSVDESEDVESDENETEYSSEEDDGLEEVDHIELARNAMKTKAYGAAAAFKTGDNTYLFYSSDDVDSDDTDCEVENTAEYEDFELFCKYYGIAGESQINTKGARERTKGIVEEAQEETSSDLDDSDELSSYSESEDDNSDDSDYVGPNKKRRKIGCSVQSTWARADIGTVKDECASEKGTGKSGVLREEKIDPLPKISRKKDEVDDRYLTVKKKAVKYKESKNGNRDGRKPRKTKQVSTREDDDRIIDSLLKSIMGDGNNTESEAHEEEAKKLSMVEPLLPLRFRFEDTDDESPPTPAYELEVEGLFEELRFALEREEIGFYKPPMIENLDDDGGGDVDDDPEATQFKLCQREKHDDIYFEDQIGLRCYSCGAVILESKYVISKLANYAPDASKRTYFYDEKHFFSAEDFYLETSTGSSLRPFVGRGTVWELVSTNIRRNLYPHQQEGFEFLWENLAGTIELSELDEFDSSSGGGCIISHAPGTGKTLLTIVFIETFLKRFPECHPVIIAPASMLLTWEAEFKKWQVGFTFHSLNNIEFSSKEMINSNIRSNKYLVRAMKLHSWAKGGSVLGLSYRLFESLAGKKKKEKDGKKSKIVNFEKMGDLLLEMPGLVFLDEGHTPRNQRSNIWNELLKLKTEKRVILSGTPFQNNFGELFNTLRLVRPATADVIGSEKIFADMIQLKRRGRKCRDKWADFSHALNNSITNKEIEKLKATISPFVHVHKGNILQSKLPGLKESVVLLNPPPTQKHFLENMEISGGLEYEHKVALVSVHPSLLLHCSNLSEKEENLMNREKLEKLRLHPDEGVKTMFILALVRLSLQLNERVLIFAQYIPPLLLIKEQIIRTLHLDDGKQVMLMKGKLKLKDRQKMINEFNDRDSEAKVLLASTRCCSEGIHLVGASRVVLLDVVWNPSVERQAISRAYRLGQEKVVYTYHLLTCGTMEEEKYDRQVEKERIAELVFSSSSSETHKSAVEVLDDKILQAMVEQLKDVFKKVSNPKRVRV